MGGLQVMQIGLMNADGFFQLLDVLCPALSKGSLGLTVPLLPLLRSSINLRQCQRTGTIIGLQVEQKKISYWLAATLSLRLAYMVWMVLMVLRDSGLGVRRRAHGIIRALAIRFLFIYGHTVCHCL